MLFLPVYVWNTQGHLLCLHVTVSVSFRATLNLPENVFISPSFYSSLHRACSSRLAVVFFSRTKWMVPPSSGFALSSEVSCQPDNPWKVIYLLFLETAFVFCSCNLLCNGMIFFFFVLISFRKFSATLSRPHPVHFPFCSTSGPLLERAGPPYHVPRFLILCGCIPAFPCHTLCNSS